MVPTWGCLALGESDCGLGHLPSDLPMDCIFLITAKIIFGNQLVTRNLDFVPLFCRLQIVNSNQDQDPDIRISLCASEKKCLLAPQKKGKKKKNSLKNGCIHVSVGSMSFAGPPMASTMESVEAVFAPEMAKWHPT